MLYPSQTPPISSTPTENESVSDGQVPEFPEFSTQMGHGGMSSGNEAFQNAETSTHTRLKNPKWTTEQNLVLLSGWIKYGTDSIVGRNQKGETYWGKIADYCNEHCSFQPPRDGASCRNHYNYINLKLGKWIGAYDNAKRMQQNGWSENDVLTRAHELFLSGNKGHFNLMSEWHAVRDQPRYGSHVGGNTSSESSGSKRSRESDASDSSSVGLPQSEPDKLFAQRQEGCRKDIERAFGVLQARFKIIREPARMWELEDLAIITRSCIILHNMIVEVERLHNMIVEDERDTYAQNWTDYDQFETNGSSTPTPFSTEVLHAFANHVRARSELRDPKVYHELQADLVKHIWAKFGMFHD